MRNYRFTLLQARLDELADSDGRKTLTDEVAILRGVLELHVNSCSSERELLMRSSTISELVTKIERVVSQCHKLESSLGQLLDKTAILEFTSKIIQIITDIVSDEDQLKKISDRLLNEIGKLGSDDIVTS